MQILISILAVYYITSVITYSNGAWGILFKIRHNDSIQKFGLLECFKCIAIYPSILIAFVSFSNPIDIIIYSIGFAGGAIFMNDIIDRL